MLYWFQLYNYLCSSQRVHSLISITYLTHPPTQTQILIGHLEIRDCFFQPPLFCDLYYIPLVVHSDGFLLQYWFLRDFFHPFYCSLRNHDDWGNHGLFGHVIMTDKHRSECILTLPGWGSTGAPNDVCLS